jgi:ABC-type lipoprotein export system ATPase subunit
LESVGLETKNSNRPAELSQGERQRVAIARALITEPSIILADEPTAGLDASRADVVMDILDAIVEKTQITLVVVTHDRHIQSRYTNVIEF